MSETSSGPSPASEARDGVRLVFPVGQPGGIRVGGPLGSGIDRQPPHLAAAGDRVRRDRDEQVGFALRAILTRSSRGTNTS